jgi:hypothetical protein
MGEIVLDAVNEERLIETFNNPSIQAQQCALAITLPLQTPVKEDRCRGDRSSQRPWL